MQRTSAILITFMLLFASMESHAGLVIKKENANTSAYHYTSDAGIIKTIPSKKIPFTTLHLWDKEDEKPKRPTNTSGWAGIVALCCGVLALVTGVTAIPAIIFGAIGLGRGKKNRGLAIAGLTLGIVTIVAFTVLMIVVYTSLK